jgi:hypothetical protein
VPGVAYDFPPGIPNSKELVSGVTLVPYLGDKDSEDGQRITGVGRIGDVVSGGSGLIATYDRHVAVDPPLTFEQIGGDPRSNHRNSINALTVEAVDTLLEIAGVDEISDLPESTANLDAISAKPTTPKGTSSKADPSSWAPPSRVSSLQRDFQRQVQVRDRGLRRRVRLTTSTCRTTTPGW